MFWGRRRPLVGPRSFCGTTDIYYRLRSLPDAEFRGDVFPLAFEGSVCTVLY